jgi:hypothetical protein
MNKKGVVIFGIVCVFASGSTMVAMKSGCDTEEQERLRLEQNEKLYEYQSLVLTAMEELKEQEKKINEQAQDNQQLVEKLNDINQKLVRVNNDLVHFKRWNTALAVTSCAEGAAIILGAVAFACLADEMWGGQYVKKMTTKVYSAVRNWFFVPHQQR